MTARTNGATANYGVNNLNQVTSDNATYSYSYDNNGNRTYRTASGGYVAMVYDDENQLIRQETDVSATYESYRFKLEYLYDGKLRLRERKYYTWQFGSWYLSTTERYVYDGMLVVQERSSNTPAVTYTRGVDLSGSMDGAGGIGGLLARSHGFNTGTGAWSTHSAYHADGNGNVTALYSTSTGSQVAWYRYDAFGRLLQGSGSLASANRMRFSSKPWMAPGVDDSAGMYYYGYRFYDPLTQRWLNRDPLGEAGGHNLYTFVGNDTINWIDPFGEQKGYSRPTTRRPSRGDYRYPNGVPIHIIKPPKPETPWSGPKPPSRCIRIPVVSERAIDGAEKAQEVLQHLAGDPANPCLHLVDQPPLPRPDSCTPPSPLVLVKAPHRDSVINSPPSLGLYNPPPPPPPPKILRLAPDAGPVLVSDDVIVIRGF